MRTRSSWAWRIGAVLAPAFLLACVLCPAGAEASTRQSSDGAQPSQQSAEDWRYCKHHSPNDSQSGAGIVYAGRPVKVTILAAFALWTSDLSLVDETGTKVEIIQSDTKDHVGDQKSLAPLMTAGAVGHSYRFSLYTYDNGLTFDSTSSNAIAMYGDGPNDRYICFEDGAPDNDFDDVVLHVQLPGGLTPLEPSSTNPFEVDVKYDDAAMLRLTNSSEVNEAIARGIEKRALKTLDEYKALLGPSEQNAVPSRLQIQVADNLKQYGILDVKGGKTSCPRSYDAFPRLSRSGSSNPLGTCWSGSFTRCNRPLRQKT